MKKMIAALLFSVPGATLAQSPEPVLTPLAFEHNVQEIRESHPNGALAKLYYTVDGQAEGLWQEWDEQGRLTYIGEWKNGRGEGIWIYFHPSGIVRERSRAIADAWHGISEGWHPNGVKAFEGEYTYGARLRPFRYWNEAGSPIGPWAQTSRNTALSGTDAQLLDFGEFPEDFAIWDFSLTPDLETVFIATGDPDGSNRRMYQREWRDGKWQALEPAPFGDITAQEGTPIVSRDGEWVYFSSDRHKVEEPENVRRDLYRASRSSGWRDVERVTNTPIYSEIMISYADDGRGVMWTAYRPDGSSEMGLYEVRFTEATETEMANIEIVASLNDLHVNDPSGENFAAISRDGETIVFANYDIGGEGTGEDLYVSRRQTEGWSEPVPLGHGVNTEAGESNPFYTADGETLLFLRGSGEGHGIYAVTAP